jgi:hypothetical protein
MLLSRRVPPRSVDPLKRMSCGSVDAQVIMQFQTSPIDPIFADLDEAAWDTELALQGDVPSRWRTGSLGMGIVPVGSDHEQQ